MIEITTYKHVSGPNLIKEITKLSSKEPEQVNADFWDWFEPVEGTSIFYAIPEFYYQLSEMAQLTCEVLIANGFKTGDQLYIDFDNWSDLIT